MPPTERTFAERLPTWALSRSVAAIAEATGAHRSTVYLWLSGAHVPRGAMRRALEGLIEAWERSRAEVLESRLTGR